MRSLHELRHLGRAWDCTEDESAVIKEYLADNPDDTRMIARWPLEWADVCEEQEAS